ncbi:TonB-dependent receptor [Mucilaginibacter robiniae]|uniref:TonB-dependent receptor n=1 Tax=Mucilaginibacter robiniae TaxID=2728022 RepID=A0A7L5E1H9_9SPHI|nr:outer membrane beta-barrel family protein [Mucilaginibacter robiniae]QJD96257.1 TonB-dependent receptor [Mucilaginibacter robiniae]
MLSGKIYNKKKQPLEAATIVLQNNSNIKKTVFSNQDGSYYFEKIQPGTYKITVTHTSYNTKDTTFTIDNNTELNLVMIEKYVQLDDVVIKSRKKFIEKKVDRIVYNVEGISLYENKAVADILKSLPRLNVTRSTIEIKGLGPAAVMVDDRLIYLSNKDLLDYLNILKDEISSIEVITNPPAKYDAQGSGLINIVTKKKKAYGLFGYLESSFTKNSYFINDGTINIGYRNKNLSLISSLGGAVGAYKETLQSSGTFFDSGQTDWRDEGKNKTKLNNDRFNVALELLLSKNTKIYSSYSLATNHNKSFKNHKLSYEYNAIIDSLGLTNGLNKDRGYTHIASAGINSVFGKNNNSLAGTIDYVNKSNSSQSNSTTVDYYNNLTPTNTHIDLYNFGDIPKNVFSTKLDFSFPKWFEKIDLETGLKYTLFNNHSRTDYDELINGVSIYNHIVTPDTFAYKEQNLAAYVSFSRNVRKWNFKGGIRFERTVTNGSSAQQDTHNTFSNFFPSLFAQYKFTDETSTDVSYTRRILRPTLFDVNPLRVYNSIFSSYIGNPYLIPSLQDNINYNFVWKSNYLFSLFYNKTHLPIVSLPYNTIGSTIEYQKENSGNLYNYGINLDASFSLNSRIRSNLSLGINGFRYHTAYNYNLSRKPLNVTFSTSQSIQFNSTFSSDINFSAVFPGANNVSTQKGYSSFDIGFTKALINKKLILTLAIQDLFRSYSQSSITSTDSFKIYTYNYYDFRQLSLSVKYKFGTELKVVKKKTNIQEIRRL